MDYICKQFVYFLLFFWLPSHSPSILFCLLVLLNALRFVYGCCFCFCFVFRFCCDALQWLHKNRKEGCSGAALAMAAASGHLSTVEWFYGNGIPGDIAKAIEAADEGGHVEVKGWEVGGYLLCEAAIHEIEGGL